MWKALAWPHHPLGTTQCHYICEAVGSLLSDIKTEMAEHINLCYGICPHVVRRTLPDMRGLAFCLHVESTCMATSFH
jgi:hypothetical protein